YIGFFGYYPIIKEILESKFSKPVEWILKILIFNVAVVLSYVVIIKVLGIPLEEMDKYGKYGAYALLAGANVVFLLYDYCFTKFISIYYDKWQSRFRKMFR
nr:hypothetical protein [Clostridiales bacterium]